MGASKSRRGKGAEPSRSAPEVDSSDAPEESPMLSVVGHPTAVNPDLRLRNTALQHDWPILDLR